MKKLITLGIMVLAASFLVTGCRCCCCKGKAPAPASTKVDPATK